VDWIRKSHRRKELKASVINELREIRFTLGAVAFDLHWNRGQVNDEFLDWLAPIMRDYDGPLAALAMVQQITELREVKEESRLKAQIKAQDPRGGLSLRKYYVTYLKSKAAELSICSEEFQRQVYRIDGQLENFNQLVDYLNGKLEMTFAPSLSEGNRQNVENSLDQGYLNLAKVTRNIVDLITRVITDTPTPQDPPPAP